MELLATRTLEELSVDLLAEHAGISKGLLYHYFGSKQEFRQAVVQRAVDDLIAQTAPPEGDDPVARLLASVRAYVAYVDTNYQGYLSLVRGAKSGDETLREIYDSTFTALGERLFAEDETGLLPDTPEARLLVRGWQALTEEMTLAWKADPGDLTRDGLVEMLAQALVRLFAD